MTRASIIGAIAPLLLAASSFAAEPVKIGMVTTLSGPGGLLGEDTRAGFELAVKEEGGTLGGVPVTLMVEDDGQNPGKARQVAERFLENDKVQIFTGIVYTNIVLAVVPEVLDAGAFYLSSNTSPGAFAGKGCNKDYFVVGRQNDSQAFTAGVIANSLGWKHAVMITPNYQAGKEAVAAFRKSFKGDSLEEIYTKLDQTDFSAEDAQIRAAKPDGVYQFLPGDGITALKQYAQAGLKETTPIIVHAMDAQTIDAVGEAALGIPAPVDWNVDFDNDANRRFVADYQKTYGRGPSYFSAYGYETARLIGSALKAVDGDVGKADAFRAALRKADFPSIRGSFKFGPNQHPIADWYMTKVVKDASGKLEVKTVDRVLKDFTDPYGKDCKL